MSEVNNILVYDVCGFPFTAASPVAVLDEIGRNISDRRANQIISITNSESVYFALRRPEHAKYIRQARFSLCDGAGVVIAGLALGCRIPRFSGPVLMEKSCEYGISRGWRQFFYGGKPGVADLLAKRLSQRFPKLIVAGVETPPFRSTPFEEDAAGLEAIQQARPDILWVGLGLLKQEQWIAAHISKLRVPWFVGVGAAFDFHAGTAAWAPRWIRHIGFEWLYRVCHEPRMLPRDARSLVFLGQALGSAASGPFRRMKSWL
jgi:N-acetylglucosaminyldiphosphoundecaprenol N-acetyl-beta-D-mannosaminyltransferase